MAKFNSMVFMKNVNKLLKGKHITEIGYKIATVGIVVVGLGLIKTDKALEYSVSYGGGDGLIDRIGADVDMASSDPKRYKFSWNVIDVTENESEK